MGLDIAEIETNLLWSVPLAGKLQDIPLRMMYWLEHLMQAIGDHLAPTTLHLCVSRSPQPLCCAVRTVLLR